MHEKRNWLLTLLLIGAACWAFFAWLIAPDYVPDLAHPQVHKGVATISAGALAIALFCIYRFEDKLDDQLAEVTGGMYYERDGMCFMPLVRVNPETRQAEISLYYQNRFGGPAECVVHLRPPANSFATHRGARDIHIPFIARPGGFGVVHQPIAVHPRSQGQMVETQMAAAVRWPRGKGDELRAHHRGMPCGHMHVDWALAYRHSEHELSGEIELHDAATLHLSLPSGVSDKLRRAESVQETITALT